MPSMHLQACLVFAFLALLAMVYCHHHHHHHCHGPHCHGHGHHHHHHHHHHRHCHGDHCHHWISISSSSDGDADDVHWSRRRPAWTPVLQQPIPAQPVPVLVGNTPAQVYRPQFQQQPQNYQWQQSQQQQQQFQQNSGVATNNGLVRDSQQQLVARQPSNNRPLTMQPLVKGSNNFALNNNSGQQQQQTSVRTPDIKTTTTMATIRRTTTINDKKPDQPAQKINGAEATPEEFDLPPPPPSRFLPEWEKARIVKLQQQQLQAKNNPPMASDSDLVMSDAVRPSPTRTQLSNKLDPSAVFLTCCRKRSVPKGCENRCNFDALNKKVLTKMFLGQDQCPMENGLDLLGCAAQDSDHTECCKEKRVQRTRAGDKCLSFCNLNPDTLKVSADASYLPCLTVLNEIKSCFRQRILNSSA